MFWRSHSSENLFPSYSSTRQNWDHGKSDPICSSCSSMQLQWSKLQQKSVFGQFVDFSTLLYTGNSRLACFPKFGGGLYQYINHPNQKHPPIISNNQQWYSKFTLKYIVLQEKTRTNTSRSSWGVRHLNYGYRFFFYCGINSYHQYKKNTSTQK